MVCLWKLLILAPSFDVWDNFKIPQWTDMRISYSFKRKLFWNRKWSSVPYWWKRPFQQVRWNILNFMQWNINCAYNINCHNVQLNPINHIIKFIVLKFLIFKYLLRTYIHGPSYSVSKDKITKSCGKSYLHSFCGKMIFISSWKKLSFFQKCCEKRLQSILML